MIDELLTGEIQITADVSSGWTAEPRLKAHWRGRKVGVLDVSRGEAVDSRLKGYWVISYVEVDADFRRKGVSVKMRKEALRLACTAGFKLTSDVVRSGYEEAFWEGLRERGEVDILDLRTGQLEGIDDEDFDEPAEDELMMEQQNYDYVYVMRCP